MNPRCLLLLPLLLSACGPGPRPAAPPAPAAGLPAPPAPAAPGWPEDLSPVRRAMEEGAAALRGCAAVHLRLDDGREVGVDADRPVEAASVIKLPLMGAVHAAWEAGDLPRTDDDVERVRQMITVSDNPAANALLRRMGRERVNRWLREQGLAETRVARPVTTRRERDPNVISARDATALLLRISRGELVSAAASTAMREVLLAQTRRSRIPAGLPEGVTVGNKTGTLRALVHDAALVELPDGRRYALAVLVDGAAPDAVASRGIARLARSVHAALAGTGAADPGHGGG